MTTDAVHRPAAAAASGAFPRPRRRVRRLRAALSLASAVTSATALPAQAPVPSPGAAFDRDGDGLIGGEEFRQFLVRRIRLPVSALDDDGDGRVSSTELRELALLLESIEEGVDEYHSLYPEGLELDSFVDYAGIEPEPIAPRGWLDRSGVLVRGKLESVGPFTAAKPLASASAATLSLSQDLDNDRTWSVLKGVVMRPFRFEDRPEFVVMPSVSVNRVSYLREEAPTVDTLALRLSLERLYRFDGSPLASVGLRANPTVITDSGLDTRIVSAELQLQPTVPSIGAGSELALGPFELRWQPALFAEYGRVIAGAGGRIFDDEADFARLGPAVEAEIDLRSLENIELALSWQYLASLLPGQRDRKRAELSLTLLLDRTEHFSIQVLYVNGDASAKLENEEYWSLGFGMKY